MLPNEFGWFMSAASIAVNLFLLILSVTVKGAVAEVKLDVARLRTDMADQRAAAAERQLKSYQELTDSLQSGYISRQESGRMHEENLRRLGSIEDRLSQIAKRSD